jgi:hypothetical protein
MSVITANQANAGAGGSRGRATLAEPGAGGMANGAPGRTLPGVAGDAGSAGSGIGGGFNFVVGSMFTFAKTTITGNTASTDGNDTGGTALM